jgi:secreted trypsin-like serine protease
MRQSPARRLLLLAALVTLSVPATASASFVERHAPPPKAEPRIVNGQPADPNEYPAQGYLQIQVGPSSFASCGGTLVGTRQFLTAAHCVTSGNTPRSPSTMLVLLGDNNLAAPNTDVYDVVDNDVNAGWNSSINANDTAMLTLDRPADAYVPMRVASTDEGSIWDPGDVMRIIGWGTTSSGGTGSSLLLEADVPIVTDSFCDAAYGNFDASIMVCAADAPGTPPANSHDTCQGDSGGPLLATDDAGFFATVGVVSFGTGCANPNKPGVYARIGDDPLNGWVNDRTPLASFDLDHAAVATKPVTLFSTSTHPDGPTGFDSFKWDFDQDGEFDDAVGPSLAVTFPAAGQRIIGLEASGPSGDRAEFYGAFDVAAAPTSGGNDGGNDGGGGDGATTLPPASTSTTPSGGGQAPPPPAVARFATLKSPKTLRARKGRFSVKVSFDATAPAGAATLSVLLKGKKIGSARVPVKPGGTSTAKVKLTKIGLRRLKRSKKLKVTLQITVGGKATKKALTIKR